MTCTSRLTCGFIGVHAQISLRCTSHRVPLMSLLAHNKETPMTEQLDRDILDELRQIRRLLERSRQERQKRPVSDFDRIFGLGPNASAQDVRIPERETK